MPETFKPDGQRAASPPPPPILPLPTGTPSGITLVGFVVRSVQAGHVHP